MLQQLLSLVLFFYLGRAVVYATLFHLVIQVLIEFTQFFNPVRNAIPEILKRFGFFMAFAINL